MTRKLVLFAWFLWSAVQTVYSQSLDLNPLKYGSASRSDAVTANRLLYRITKDSVNCILRSNYVTAANKIPYKYEVYYPDTNASHLIYSENLSAVTDSILLHYPLDNTKPAGTYFIRLSFSGSGVFSSRFQLQRIIPPPAPVAVGCQLIANPDFVSVGDVSGGDPFPSGAIANWADAWGTPQVNQNATPALNYAMLWHGAMSGTVQWGEGTKQNLASPVIAGRNYALVVEAKLKPGTTVAVDQLKVKLTTANSSGLPLISQASGDPVPSFSGQTIYTSSPVTSSAAWLTLGGCFTPLGFYDQLVLWPEQNPSHQVAAWAAIKSVHLYDLTPKTETLTLSCAGTATLGGFDCSIPNVTYAWLPTAGLSNPAILNPVASPTVSTTYTLSINFNYSGSGTCSYQNYSRVIVPATSPLSVSGTQSICVGGTATFTASGASSYTWQPGAVTGGILQVTPAVTTTYTLNAGYANGCVKSRTITLNVLPTPPALSLTATPNVTACPGANTRLSATGSGLTYTWQPGNLMGNPIIVAPTLPAYYTVTASNVYGCSQSASIWVNPISCCTAGDGIPLTATSGTVSGGLYYLNSPLWLTGDLNLMDVRIFMGTNAEIIIPNGARLTIASGHLLGCPQMWKGIRCLGTRASVVVIKNSLIEDAITAIDLKNVTAPASTGDPRILYLQESTFNKNFTAVNIDGYTTTAADYPMLMTNNVFTSRALITYEHRLLNPMAVVNYGWPSAANIPDLKSIASFPASFNPDVDLQTGYQFSVANYASSNLEIPYAGVIARQGIYLKDVYSPSNTNGFRMNGGAAGVVLSDFVKHNVFDNMNYGINALNSNVYSGAAAYQYMQQYVSGTLFPNFRLYDGGVGINSISNTSSGFGSSQTYNLAVIPNAGGYNKSSNFFFNCAYGVKTSDIQFVNVDHAVFHSSRSFSANSTPQYNAPIAMGEYGVYSKSADYRGIYLRFNSTANINKALVYIADYSSGFMGIIRAQYVGAINIQNNKLRANYGTVQGTASMAQAIGVDNLISPTGLSFAYGSPVPVFVSGNNIDKAFTGITASNWNKQRLIDNSNVISLSDNGDVYQNQYGILHTYNMADNIISNKITGFGTGKMWAYGIMAIENKSQSMWCNTTASTFHGVSFNGSQNLTSWRENKLSNHVRAMMLDNVVIGNQGAMGQPVNNLWNGSWPAGTAKTYVRVIDPGTLAENSKLYLSNVPAPSENMGVSVAVKYKAPPLLPQSLFYTTGSSGVLCSSGIINMEVAMEPSQNPANPTAFKSFEGNLQNMATGSYPYGRYLGSNIKNSQLAVYAALQEEPDLVANPYLKEFSNANASSSIAKFFKTEEEIAKGNLAMAKELVNTISPQDTVEQTAKRFYQIYLDSKTQSYTADDDKDLKALANGCPEQLGVAVYQARTLLNSLYEVYYQYGNRCMQYDDKSSGRMAQAGSDTSPDNSPLNFIIYPNPSKGLIYFSTNTLGVEACKVTVYDVNGKTIFVKDYTDGTQLHRLDLNLNNGVYFMQLIDNTTGDVYKQKFVIQ